MCTEIQDYPHTFEIVSNSGSSNTVRLWTCRCTCQMWQKSGLPCAHAVCASLYRCKAVALYTDYVYTVAAFRETYRGTIQPIPELKGKEYDSLSDSQEEDRPILPPKRWDDQKSAKLGQRIVGRKSGSFTVAAAAMLDTIGNRAENQFRRKFNTIFPVFI